MDEEFSAEPSQLLEAAYTFVNQPGFIYPSLFYFVTMSLLLIDLYRDTDSMISGATSDASAQEFLTRFPLPAIIRSVSKFSRFWECNQLLVPGELFLILTCWGFLSFYSLDFTFWVVRCKSMRIGLDLKVLLSTVWKGYSGPNMGHHLSRIIW